MSLKKSSGFPLPAQIDGHAMRRVCFDIPDVAEYRQAFWGHVWELGRYYMWNNEGVDEDTAVAAADYWTQVLNITSERWHAQLDCLDDGGCVEYDNTAPFIQYFPNDPRYTPDLVPDGYNSPPWYFATAASNIAYGTQDGDIVTSLDRFPPGSLPTIIPASGLPRCRVNVNFGSAGTVRVYLRNMVAGSLIQATVDDDILTLNYFDVTKDLLSVPAETGQEVIYEHTFETPGQHHIDLIVVSMVNDQIPFLFHGGAVFKVEICGGLPVVPTITNIRLNECGLEVQYDGQPEWELVGQVMTPTADCDFTEEVTIDVAPSGLTGRTISHRNSGGTPGDTNLVEERYFSRDSNGDDKEMARIQARWWTPATGSAGFQYYTLYAGAIRSTMQVGYDWAMRLLVDNLVGQDSGLEIWRRNAMLGNYQMLSIRHVDSGVRPYTVYDDGHVVHGLVSYSPSLTKNALVINAIAGSGTPGNGFGSSILFAAQSSVSEVKTQGTLEASWYNATDANREARLRLYANDWSGRAEVVQVGSSAGQSLLGVHGNDAVPQPVVTGGDTNETLTSLLTALDAVGYIENQGTVGTPTAIADALGDRNLPPAIVGDECKAANYLAEWLRDTISITYSGAISPVTAINVYQYFNSQHGWVSVQLWNYALEVVDDAADAVNIVNEIDSQLGDMVLAIVDNLYDRTAAAQAVYDIGWTTSAGVLLTLLANALTVPTWQELAFLGSVAATETYPCSPCAGGDPVEGEWAIEWDGPGSDWVATGCGSGWDFELFCGGWSFGLNSRLPVVSAGTVQWDRVEVQIAYTFDDTRSIHSSLNNGVSSRVGPTVSLVDTETSATLLWTGISSYTSDNGGYLQIQLGTDASPGPGVGEAIAISRIRIEGSLEIPNNNGLEC